jgi:hypothetical protein
MCSTESRVNSVPVSGSLGKIFELLALLPPYGISRSMDIGDNLTRSDRMYFVPAIVQRVVNPLPLDHDHISKAQRTQVGVNVQWSPCPLLARFRKCLNILDVNCFSIIYHTLLSGLPLIIILIL